MLDGDSLKGNLTLIDKDTYKTKCIHVANEGNVLAHYFHEKNKI